jgi:DNA-binding Lrp family transcriptional regulator
MVEAYVLVQTEVGRAAEVAAAVEDLHGVLLSESVTGPYDVVVRVQATSVDDLGSLVLSGIAAVPGITRTVTCTIMHE